MRVKVARIVADFANSCDREIVTKNRLLLWRVWVVQSRDQLGEHRSHLYLVAAHQNRVFQSVLADLAYLFKILLHDLVLFHASDDVALGGTPDDFFTVRHVAYILGSVTPCWP